MTNNRLTNNYSGGSGLGFLSNNQNNNPYGILNSFGADANSVGFGNNNMKNLFDGAGKQGGGIGDWLKNMNFDKIGQGIGILGDIMGAYGAMKQFGLAEDSFNHQVDLDRTNSANQIALAQQRLDLQSQRRQHERPDLFQGQYDTQLRNLGQTP